MKITTPNVSMAEKVALIDALWTVRGDEIAEYLEL